MDRTRLLVLQALVAVLVVLGYGVLTRSHPSTSDADVRRDAPTMADVEALRREVDQVRALRASAPAPAGAGTPVERLSRIEARLEALERADAERGAGPREAGAPPGIVRSQGRSFTEEEVRATQALLAEVERRRSVEAAHARAKRLLALAGADATGDAQARAVDALVAYEAGLRDAFPAGSGGTTEEERQATAARVDALRERLERSLADVLPAPVVDRVLEAAGAVRLPTPPR